ncbi:spore germination protein (amino acid permease) [Paenibacillus taihuensis]|uniref:Spore germination protein (Amino acid permease) n=1 Tax=Paenibacillus taihuensis TaxID=1156355 RepID=A0A3D9QWE0_9BACL|nr:endospore germination permease [Paenibacillus taihuensis]REE69717.1 spore germination protein (amino acid permease) [Paenibacillus taihuensis]
MKPVEQLSGIQFSLLLFSFISPTVILIIPSLMAQIAQHDAWISIFPAITCGALSIWVMTTLSKRYPGLTIIEYSSRILGKWAGKALGCYFIFYWVHVNLFLLNQHVQFINTVLLMKSPAIVISLTLAIVCAIAVYLGIESIARSNEYLSLLIFVFFIPLLFLMLAESNPERLFPVMSKGIVPVLRASIYPVAYLSQFFIIGWFLPYLNQPGKAIKASFFSLSAVSALLAFTLIPLIMVFGPLTDNLTFPLLSVIQYIGITGSFERLEAFAVVIWVTASFVKISLTFFIICLSIGQLFNLNKYRHFIVPITLFSVIGSVSLFHNSTELGYFLRYTYPIYAFFTQLILPLLLLMIDTFKRFGNKTLQGNE